MSTLITLRSSGKNPKKANSLAQKRIIQIEKKLSTTLKESEIYKINHSYTFPLKISDETAELLQFTLDMAYKTDGALNPCLYPVTAAWGFTTEQFRIPSQTEITSLLNLCDYKNLQLEQKNDSNQLILKNGMMLDFGASGKGFAGDEAIKVLMKNGIKSAVIDLGGNVQVLGPKINADRTETLWNIGIKSPWGGDPLAGVKVRDKAVVTSGGYERFFTGEDGKKYIHIFDGNTGCPAESDMTAVTIIADSGLYADSLSTAMFVMGKEKAVEWWKSHRDFEMIIVEDENTVLITGGLENTFYPIHQFKQKITVR